MNNKPCPHPCPWQGKETCRECSNNTNGGKIIMKNNQRRVKKQTKYNSIKNGFNRTVEQEQLLANYYKALCKA